MVKLLLVLAVLLTEICGLPLEFGHVLHPLRIVGGKEARKGQFPWQVSLRNEYGRHFCGGSIIFSNWILTAAHCVVERSSSNITVIADSIRLSSGGDSYEVSRIFVHKLYDAATMKYDIALLEISSEIVFSNDVQAIPLETERLQVVDCTLSGWGTTDYMGEVPDTLQYIELKTITNFECMLWLKLSPNSVTSNHICTFTKYGEGACHGDSGGPLVAGGKQIGIVSWGNPCAIEFPDVYTRVSDYATWIDDIINGR